MQPIAAISALFVFFSLANCQDEQKTVADAFAKAKIVPDLTPTAPKQQLAVGYAIGTQALLGNKVSADEVQDEPLLGYAAPDTDLHTLLVFDAPSGSQAKTVRWLVANIPGNDLEQGKTLESYRPPQPGSAAHRYVFLIFKQSGRIQTSKYAGPANFDVKRFVADSGLEKTPVAGNFFLA